MKPFSKITLIILVALSAITANGQRSSAGANDSLYTEIRKADSLMFSAFNNRDLAVFEKMFTKNLEFFHDKGGLSFYDNTVDFLKKLIADKSDLRRDILIETLEVYPVPGYGAIETGEHRFTHTENGKTDTAVFKFVHVWQYKDGEWKVSRVVSYGH